MKRTSACGSVGAMLGRGVPLGVTDGVTGERVIVNVGITVAVGLGSAVGDEAIEGRVT